MFSFLSSNELRKEGQDVESVMNGINRGGFAHGLSWREEGGYGLSLLLTASPRRRAAVIQFVRAGRGCNAPLRPATGNTVSPSRHDLLVPRELDRDS
jgi:hypothetical protein